MYSISIRLYALYIIYNIYIDLQVHIYIYIYICTYTYVYGPDYVHVAVQLFMEVPPRVFLDLSAFWRCLSRFLFVSTSPL